MYNIDKITIDLDTAKGLKNIPFCLKNVSYIDNNNNGKLEKYILLTTNFQLNMLTNSTQLFIDATFKVAPRGFYQVLNIAGYIPQMNGIIPLILIPMTSKSENIYNKVFTDIFEYISLYKIDINKIPKRIMCDFEIALQNSIKENFSNSVVDGCYFHYVKILWDKIKK